MKKFVSVLLVSAMLAGCATGPEKGHYYKDENGQTQYEPSADAKNADRLDTLGAIAVGLTSVAALAIGIVALNKR